MIAVALAQLELAKVLVLTTVAMVTMGTVPAAVTAWPKVAEQSCCCSQVTKHVENCIRCWPSSVFYWSSFRDVCGEVDPDVPRRLAATSGFCSQLLRFQFFAIQVALVHVVFVCLVDIESFMSGIWEYNAILALSIASLNPR